MKKILALSLVALLPWGLFGAVISGIPVTSKITTGSTANTNFSIGDTAEMTGTSKQAADIAARDAIPASRRTEGMTCWVISESKWYRLVGGIANGDWQEIVSNTSTVPEGIITNDWPTTLRVHDLTINGQRPTTTITNILYASQIVSSNNTPIENTELLNSYLTNNNPKELIIDQHITIGRAGTNYAPHSLWLGSNTKVTCYPGVVVTLQSNSSCLMLQGYMMNGDNYNLHNIEVQGGIWDGGGDPEGVNQGLDEQGHRGADFLERAPWTDQTAYLMGFWFSGMEDLYIHDLTMTNIQKMCIFLGGHVRRVNINNVWCVWTDYLRFWGNQNAVQCEGDADYINIQNIFSNTDDDFIAFNFDEIVRDGSQRRGTTNANTGFESHIYCNNLNKFGGIGPMLRLISYYGAYGTNLYFGHFSSTAAGNATYTGVTTTFTGWTPIYIREGLVFENWVIGGGVPTLDLSRVVSDYVRISGLRVPRGRLGVPADEMGYAPTSQTCCPELPALIRTTQPIDNLVLEDIIVGSSITTGTNGTPGFGNTNYNNAAILNARGTIGSVVGKNISSSSPLLNTFMFLGYTNYGNPADGIANLTNCSLAAIDILGMTNPVTMRNSGNRIIHPFQYDTSIYDTTNRTMRYAGDGSGVSNLNALMIYTTNAPVSGTYLRFDGTNFHWSE